MQNETDRICNEHGEMTDSCKTLLERPKDYAGGADVDSIIIIKWNSKKCRVRALAELYWHALASGLC